jgi:dihydroxyacetone kinase-like protein
MKKLINGIDTCLLERLDGFVQAHAHALALNRQPTVITRAHALLTGKVALVSGGGIGHEPLHAGFVGPGMLDAACPGQVFTSPTPDQPQAAAEAPDAGAGVLFVVKNYTCDITNFEMVAEAIGGPNASVLVNDDIAVEEAARGRLTRFLNHADEMADGDDALAPVGRRSRPSGSRSTGSSSACTQLTPTPAWKA